MRILDIEKLFAESKLDEVFKDKEIVEDIEKVDYWSDVRKKNLTDNPEEITKALNELSGCYGNLRTVLAIAETELTNREVRKYNSLKIELVNKEIKFTSQIDSATKKQASGFVGDYRRIYNIIKAYVETADKHICTLQSILKKWTKDFQNTQG